MKVLALSTFPSEAAATRFRVEQYVCPLAEAGIQIGLKPFLTGNQFRALYGRRRGVRKLAGLAGSVERRLANLMLISKYDLLLVQREAMPFGPAIFEQLYRVVGRIPMVLDLDDATYVRYVSPTYGRLGSALKFFGKTDKLIDRAELVICGNRYIAEHVEGRGKRAVVIPTIVDTDIFTPAERPNEVPVIGWIGTHSTFPFLEKLFPVLTELAWHHGFVLRIVGAGRERVEVEGVEVVNLRWSLDREVEDFQSLDIGLYPIDLAGSLDAAWLAGKSGFKAIQYLAVGVPFVMTPVGVCSEIGEDGRTHFNATSEEDWYNSLNKLLSDSDLRRTMGAAGRLHSVENYNLQDHAELLVHTLKDAASKDR